MRLIISDVERHPEKMDDGVRKWLTYIALGAGFILLVLLLGRAFVNANPATLARGVRWGLGVLAVLILVVLFATEQLGPALALSGGLLGVALRGRALWQHFRVAGGLHRRRPLPEAQCGCHICIIIRPWEDSITTRPVPTAFHAGTSLSRGKPETLETWIAGMTVD